MKHIKKINENGIFSNLAKQESERRNERKRIKMKLEDIVANGCDIKELSKLMSEIFKFFDDVIE